MRVLITGGYGFVGTELIKLLPKSFETTVLDSLIGYGYTKPSNLPENHTFIQGDIRDKNLIGDLVRVHDIVVHLAGIVGYPACSIDEELSYDINVTGTKNIADALTRTQKCIFISSSSVYGHQTIDSVDERVPARPLTNYAEHKEIGERIIEEGAGRWITFRPATAFGASSRLRLDLLPNTLIYKALVDKSIDLYEPKSVRPFIHVHDFARALLFAIDGNVPWNQVYNLGNDSLTMRKEDVVKLLQSLSGTAVTHVPGKDLDQRNYWLDCSKFYNTGFVMSPNTFEFAYQQLVRLLPTFEGRLDQFSSPALLKQSLRKNLYVHNS